MRSSNGDASSPKVLLAVALKHANDCLGSETPEFSLSAEHQEEIRQLALGRVVQGFAAISQSDDWASDVQLCCHGAIEDYLRFKRTAAEVT